MIRYVVDLYLRYYRIDVILVSLDPAGLLVDLSVIHIQAAVISTAENLPEKNVHHDVMTSDHLPAVLTELHAEHTELARVARRQLQVVVLAARVIRGVITCGHQVITLIISSDQLTYGHKVEAV